MYRGDRDIEIDGSSIWELGSEDELRNTRSIRVRESLVDVKLREL